MRIAIQQPHFFPWLGYFDKMAKVDAFVLMDEVQLEKRSPMTRNRILARNGDIRYFTIAANQRGSREKPYREIPLSEDPKWKVSNCRQLQDYYQKAPCYREIMPLLEAFYRQEFQSLCDCTVKSIRLVKELLEIPTELPAQSRLDYDKSQRKSDLVLALCLAAGADTYLAGRGASMRYLEREKFAEKGVEVIFQDFQHPVYPQCNSTAFVPGISTLDMLFNCGVRESRRIFWETVKNGREFDGTEG